MGTRADFYVGRGERAEWLGSIAFDGYVGGIPVDVLMARTEQDFRERVARELAARNDATVPADGWPWPWQDSRTTDYAYAFDGGKVWAACFGYRWLSPDAVEDDDACGPKECVFPVMNTATHAKAGHARSGVMLFTTLRHRAERMAAVVEAARAIKEAVDIQYLDGEPSRIGHADSLLLVALDREVRTLDDASAGES